MTLLWDLVQENLEHVIPVGYTEEELAYAEEVPGRHHGT